MKFPYITAAAFLIYTGCKSRQDEKVTPPVDTATTISVDTATIITDTHYFWNADWDQKKGLVMKKATPLSKDSLTVPVLIQKMNALYPDIRLTFRKISGDTIFVAINKSNYLTRQVGSTGAKGYLAEVTFNLTELSNINYVDLKFKQGDHATPGTYSRTDFVR